MARELEGVPAYLLGRCPDRPGRLLRTAAPPARIPLAFAHPPAASPMLD